MFENVFSQVCPNCGSNLKWSRELTDHDNLEGKATHYYTAYGFCSHCKDDVEWVEGSITFEYDLSEIEWE